MSPSIHTQSYAYFLTEAQDLLQTIEQGVITLRTDRTTGKVHELMRAAHTLKGAAASVGLTAVSNVSHVLEDIFRAFYNPEVVIDAEIEGLLFQGYECLRLLLTAQFDQAQVDEAEMLNRAAGIIAQIQTKLGDRFDRDAPIPTSAELGFDMVQSMFEIGVTQRLEELSQASAANSPQLSDSLRTNAEVFLGLAESLELPGFAAIAQAGLTALERHPDRVQEIARAVLADSTQGQAAVLAGDRAQGGSASPTLLQLAGLMTSGAIGKNPQGASVSFPAKPNPVKSSNQFLPNLIAVLQTEIYPQRWLHGMFGWVTGQIAGFSTSPQSAAPSTNFAAASGLESDAIEQPFPALNLGLEDLFGTAESQSSNSNFQPSAAFAAEAPSLEPHLERNLEPSDLTPPAVPKAQTAPPALTSYAPAAPARSVRVELDKLEQLNYLTGELLINQNQQVSQENYTHLMVQDLLEAIQRHRQTLQALYNQFDRLPSAAQSSRQVVTLAAKSLSATRHFDDLELDRYTDAHVLAQAALNEAVELGAIAETVDQTARQFRHALEMQQRLLFLVGNDLTAIRMHPLEDLFKRLAQVIQQLSTAHNKPVEVVLTGTQVSVDKTIVEKLYDPLLHLVRNAFDHGIEAPELRQANGKPTIGRIEIKAFHQGSRTVIEVQDDGSGINLQRIGQRAIEMGWLSAEEMATVSEAKLLSFLFESGFSTAAQVSDLSGRGVGLDVVRVQSQAFKGSVSVNFVPQQGTTFSLQIPLSLTIAKLLVCQSRGIPYALPLESVEQVIVAQPDQLTVFDQQQVLQWQQDDRAVSVPIRPLVDLLEYADSPIQIVGVEAKIQSSIPPLIVLLRTSTGLVGIQVEQVIGEQELVIRPLGTAIAPPPYIYGCSVISSNQLALVIDIKMLLQQEQAIGGQPSDRLTRSLATDALATGALTADALADSPQPAADSHSPRRRPHHFRILLVEDSLTLRQTLSQLLNRTGYEVCQAKDGLDAIAFLQKDPGIDLIISDIEMPRMNGFEFLSQRRQHLSLSNIPVVMLTSRSTAKYRQFALELGAAAFMTKPYADGELLATVNNLLQP